MSTRGRKPDPQRLKILKSGRTSRLSAETSPSETPERPSHLDDDAKGEWDRLVELLSRRGTLSKADGAALSLYCVAYSRWQKARADIEKRGLVIETALGGIKPNPAATIASKCEDQMARLLSEFGCTPTSRSRVKAGGEAKQDRLSEFLSKRKAR
jgi:P27 family predicted phage terminase small subunit